MMHYVKFLLSTVRSECHAAKKPWIKSLLMHGIVGTVLAYLKCSMYCVYWVVFILVGTFTPGIDLLVCL